MPADFITVCLAVKDLSLNHEKDFIRQSALDFLKALRSLSNELLIEKNEAAYDR